MEIKEKIEKFESKLVDELDELNKEYKKAKAEYKSNFEKHGFNIDFINGDITKIQLLEAKIETYESILDDFSYIFERGNE